MFYSYTLVYTVITITELEITSPLLNSSCVGNRASLEQSSSSLQNGHYLQDIEVVYHLHINIVFDIEAKKKSERTP